MKIQAQVLTALASLVFTFSLNADSYESQWKSVIIQRSVLTDLVSDSSCFSQSPEAQQPLTYLGCVAVLDTLVKISFKSPSVDLLPLDYVLANPALVRQMLGSFGPWAAVFTNSPKEQLRLLREPMTAQQEKELFLKRQSEKRQALVALWNRESSVPPGQRTSFSQTVSYYLDRTGVVVDSASDREMLTTALNRFVQERYDLHSRIQGDSRSSSNEASQRSSASNSEVVESTVFLGAKGARVGALKLSHFSVHNLEFLVQSELKKLLNQNINSLILDLRDNPGGSLEEMAGVAGLFVGPNQLLATLEYFDERPDHLIKTPSDIEQVTQLPLVILVNSKTMSAAESLAIALRDLDRAWLIGQTTYGKGVGQNFVNERADFLSKTEGLVWTKTLFRNISPGGEHFQGYGITPDFKIAMPQVLRDHNAAIVYREIEENPFAFYNQNLSPSNTQPRQLPLSAPFSPINNCLDAPNGLAEKLWTPFQEGRYHGYYNMLKAIDLAQCLVTFSH